MPNWNNSLLQFLLFCLTVNALVYTYNLFKDLTEQQTQVGYQNQVIPDCCKKTCEQNNSRLEIKKEIVHKLLHTHPKLDPWYRQNSYVRLGSDLKFDLEQCPSNSIMHGHSNEQVPKHLDCPTLYLIGARKGGTSSLYHYISKHPDFRGTKLDAGPKVGETFYFSTFYESRTWNQYLSLFPKGGVMTGEASVGNLVHSLAPSRLYQSCGKLAKVVILLRNPVNRFQSNFLMRARLRTGGIFAYSSISLYMHKQLNDFLHQMQYKVISVQQVKKEWEKFVGLYGPAENLIYEGLYYVHLMNWLCNFPAENIMIISSEEFYQNPGTILALVFQFLDLKRLDGDTNKWITSTAYNKGRYSNVSADHKLSHSDRLLLMGTYRPFNYALLDLLQWDPIYWNN